MRFSYWILPIPRCTFFHPLITSENGMCLTNKGMPSLIGSVFLILAKHKKIICRITSGISELWNYVSDEAGLE